MIDSQAMQELVSILTERKFAHRRQAGSETTRALIEHGFIEPIYGNNVGERFYKLTQRGVDEAKRFAEGQKATLEGNDND
jgi:hypothetical protein